jgi:hypothetical protein
MQSLCNVKARDMQSSHYTFKQGVEKGEVLERYETP